MFGEIFRGIFLASVLMCAASAMIRSGPMKEILRIVLGILVMQSIFLPLLQIDHISEYRPMSVAAADVLEEENEQIYQDALSEVAERMIEDYFINKGMDVAVQVGLENNEIGHIILSPAETYKWTQEDTELFTIWSGIPEEKQEWIWS